MVDLELTFNPYKIETELKVQGELKKKDFVERLCGPDGMELSIWSTMFFERAVNEFNDSVSVIFNGIQRDYEFLEDALKIFPEEGSVLKRGTVAKPEDRLLQLKALFAKMQKETPFDILKSESLKHLFERATSSDFEMAAVATVSSGKSTLINAILGNELLPARQEATTATIARIHEVDGMDDFKAVTYDVEGNQINEYAPLTLQVMNGLNDEKEVAIIEIQGRIPGIESKSLKLVLTDTPGPNNSKNKEHRAHTYKLLHDDYKPMILYILNSSALEVNDDDMLLSDVAKAMNSGGRQSHERFIFILNKAEEFDPAKGEPVAKKIDDVKKYLERHGISNPRIFPISAKMAKVLRQSRSGIPLTEYEEDVILPQTNTFIKREWRHLSDLAPLSPSCKEQQQRMIQEAKDTFDDKGLALVYTGVPAIELTISEYLEKYALPAKIAKGVSAFKDKIASLKIEADTKKCIEEDEQKLEDFLKTIIELEQILQKQDRAQNVKLQIESLSIDSEIKNALVESGEKLSSSFRTMVKNMNSNDVLVDDANRFLTTIKNTIPDIQSKFVALVQKALNTVLRTQAQKCIEDYKNYVEGILGEVQCPEIAKIIIEPVPITVDSIYDEYVFDKDVIVGTHYELEDSSFFKGLKSIRSRFANSMGWESFLGKKAQKEVKEWETKQFVDFGKFLDDVIYPRIAEFEKHTRNIATTWAVEQADSFKQFFIKHLANLDSAIKKKIQELKDVYSSVEKRKKAIEENQNNLIWLDHFISELDNILSI